MAWKVSLLGSIAPDLSGVAHMNGNKVLLSAAASFRNEPFNGQTCS